jgi:hypothetical protein
MDEIIKIRVSADDKAAFAAMAASEGLTLSGWARLHLKSLTQRSVSAGLRVMPAANPFTVGTKITGQLCDGTQIDWEVVHIHGPGKRRHEYDHYLGYAAEHHEHVQAVCSKCHHEREEKRGR